MNNFENSLYDFDDESTSSKNFKMDDEYDSFNFSDYLETPSSLSDKNNNQQNINSNGTYNTKEQQQQAAQEMFQGKSKALRGITDPNFLKGAASGATLGISEKIPGLKPEGVLGTAGEFIGQTAPIMKASKLVSYPLKQLSKTTTMKNFAKYSPKIYETLNSFLHGSSTGGVYESGKQTGKAITGDKVDLTQIPKTALEFGAFSAAAEVLPPIIKDEFRNLFNKNQQEQILKGIIPENLSKSQFAIAEEILNLFKESGPEQGRQVGRLATLTERGRPLSGERITNPQDIGLRPTPTRGPNQPLSDRVGDIFSQNRFYNTTQGGQALRNEITAIDADVYRGVGELYEASRELNRSVYETHPELVNSLEERLYELSQIPEPSDVERRLIRTSQNLLNRLTNLDNNGNLIQYLPMNNQTLIDQIQSLRRIVDYDFAHGNPKNIFRPLINDIQNSVITGAEKAGNQQAVEAFGEARQAYRSWVEAFDNPYVRPFRDQSNQDVSKLFKGSLDLDESNMLRNILNLTPRGQELANASVRSIVEKNLQSFFKNPQNYTLPEFNIALRELEAVITPQQSQQIRDQFREATQRPNIRARKTSKPEPTNDQNIAAKYLEKKPEDIQKLMNSRSGIRELKKDMSTKKINQEVFERLKQQKIRSILREGNIEKNFTGEELYKALNKEKNYELLSELLGENEIEELRLAAKEIGKKQVKQELKKTKLTSIGKKYLGYKIIGTILALI